MPLTVNLKPNFTFEVTNDANNADIDQYLVTINRQLVATEYNNGGSNDNYVTRYITADSTGKLPRTSIQFHTDGTSETNDYYDVSYIITSVGLDSDNLKVNDSSANSTVIKQYVKPPQISDVSGDVTVGTGDGFVIVTAAMKADSSLNAYDPSTNFFNENLKFLVQIDGFDSSVNGVYQSRTSIVDGSNGALSYNSSTNGGFSNIENGQWYDIAVIAFNDTGSTGNITNTTKVQVSASANPPSAVTISDFVNTNSSDGIMTVNITTNAIPNLPDLSYNITFTKAGESSAEFTKSVNTTLVNNAIAAPTTFDMSGLTAGTEYTVSVSAFNSVGESNTRTTANQTPESLPTNLDISSLEVGTDASGSGFSGKIKVTLSNSLAENGTDVSFIVATDVSNANSIDAAGLSTIEANLTAKLNTDGSYTYLPDTVDGDISGLVFDITGLTNGETHFVAVRAINNSGETGSTDVSATAFSTDLSGVAPVSETLAAPGITSAHPQDGVRNDASSNDINVSGSQARVVVSVPTTNATTAPPTYEKFVISLINAGNVDASATITLADASYLELDGNGDILLNVNGIKQVDADNSFNQLFTGLTNGTLYDVSVQLFVVGVTNPSEATVQVRPSELPTFNTSASGKIYSTFDISNLFVSTAGDVIAFGATGASSLISEASGNGYDVSSANIVFVNNNGNSLDQVYYVDENGSSTLVVDNTPLSADASYTVAAIPQNSTYSQTSYANGNAVLSFTGVSTLDGVKVSSQRLGLSTNNLTNIDGSLVLTVAPDVNDSSNTTFSNIAYKLLRKIPDLSGVTDISFAGDTQEVTNGSGTITSSGSSTITFVIDSAYYGWLHYVDLSVNSVNKNDGISGTSTVSYVSTAATGDATPAIRPTIELSGNVATILPNGATSDVQIVDLSGSTTSVEDPSFTTIRVNRVRKNGTIVDLSASAIDPSNVVTIDASNTLQIIASNSEGNSVLFSESALSLEVVENNGNTVSITNLPIDGQFAITVGGNSATVKLVLAENA